MSEENNAQVITVDNSHTSEAASIVTQPITAASKTETVMAHQEFFGNGFIEDVSKPRENKPKVDKFGKPIDPIYTWADPPEIPTQETGIKDVQFDFNDGCRVRVGVNAEKPYRVIYSDYERGMVLFDDTVKPGQMTKCIKKYYIKYQVQIFDGDKKLFEHIMDLTDQEVVIQNPVGSLGDGIAWFSYFERFQEQYKCHLIAYMSPHHIAIFANQYPNMRMTTTIAAPTLKPYATYFTGLFFKGNQDFQTMDFRHTGIHTTIAYMLGIDDDSDVPPRVDLTAPRQIKEPYVCIAVHGSSPIKQWTNPNGWYDVVKYLKSFGYKVVCMDKNPVEGNGIYYNSSIPWGTEDYTGDKTLQERINILKDADFFIGGSSGLAWLAWCARTPVVLISGFTLPMTEFKTPYRIINPHVCHGCWNDMRVDFDHFDFRWCPYHRDTGRELECTRLISPMHVINTIKKIPAFQKQKEAFEASLNATK